MDFEAELKKLLAAEENLPIDPLSELTLAQVKVLDSISKRNTDISIQVEEIYDIVKDADENAREVKNAAKRETILLDGLIAISDLLDSVLEHILQANPGHANVIGAKREEIIKACGVDKISMPGMLLDPRLHTVVAAEYSEKPIEEITRVLENGYEYRGKIVRKSTVIISKGQETHDSWN